MACNIHLFLALLAFSSLVSSSNFPIICSILSYFSMHAHYIFFYTKWILKLSFIIKQALKYRNLHEIWKIFTRKIYNKYSKNTWNVISHPITVVSLIVFTLYVKHKFCSMFLVYFTGPLLHLDEKKAFLSPEVTLQVYCISLKIKILTRKRCSFSVIYINYALNFM